MKPKSSNTKSPTKPPAERMVKDIRRQTRRHFSAEDVTDTLDLALTASGCDSATVLHKPGCSATTAPAPSLANWRNISRLGR